MTSDQTSDRREPFLTRQRAYAGCEWTYSSDVCGQEKNRFQRAVRSREIDPATRVEPRRSTTYYSAACNGADDGCNAAASCPT